MEEEKTCACVSKHVVEANEPHTCPFAEEIYDDEESLCTCCDICTMECAYDI